MNARTTAAAPAAHPRGFALVGVIMFVLVLTILGLSLFSLASFESQFLNISANRLESFYAASDGLERARFTLLATGTLQSVKTLIPDGTIVYAVAKQGTSFAGADSFGSVIWNGDDIWVRTLAIRRGQRTLLETRFKPHEPVDYYHRLMTLSGDVTVKTDANYPNSPPDVPRFTLMTGEVWKSGPRPYPPVTTPTGTGVAAVPNVGGYFSQYLGLATSVTDPGNSEHWTLTAHSPFQIFKTTNGANPYSVSSTKQNPSVTVSGLAIWLLPRGIRAVDKLTISGSGALMIVAGKTTDPGIDKERGFNFLGGLQASIPIILVTDGIVGIEHKNNTVHESASMPMVSIYARDAVFMGPDLGVQTLAYVPVVGQIIDTLYGLDILPSVNSGTLSRLEPLPGTWRDITDSNPS